MSDGQPYQTPAVRRLAASLGVNVSAVTGTGVGGRVRLADVRAAYDAAWRTGTPDPAPAQPSAAAGPPEDAWFPGPVDLAGRPVDGDPWAPPAPRGAR